MTFGEMYSLGQTLYDKSGSPYLPEEQFDQLANIAYNDWVENEYRKLETDQEHTSRIHLLYKPFTKPNDSIIKIATDLTEFRYLIRFNAKFEKICNGVTTYPVVPVVKAQNDDVDILQTDPFNKGNNEEPLYIATNDGVEAVWQVFSETVPLELNGTYVRNPQKIDSQNNPNTVFELADYIAEEVVMLAMKKTEVVIENYNRAKAEAAEIQQRVT